jgi:hypothetical protein
MKAKGVENVILTSKGDIEKDAENQSQLGIIVSCGSHYLFLARISRSRVTPLLDGSSGTSTVVHTSRLQRKSGSRGYNTVGCRVVMTAFCWRQIECQCGIKSRVRDG